jgi:Ca2+-binding RTX toxin-like protein
MSIQSFSDYFYSVTGQNLDSLIASETLTQSSFSVNYTAWLDTVLLADSDVQTWLESQLTDEQWAEFQAGNWHIDLEQNSSTAAPIIDFGDGSTFALDALFANEDKEDFDWHQGKATQTRWFYDDASVPHTDNDVTIEFIPTIKDNGAGDVAIGHFVASDPDDANPSFTYEKTASTLTDDSTTGDLDVNFDGLNGSHTYTGSVTVKATDSFDGDSATTSFNLLIGSNGAETLTADDSNGSGTIIDGRGGGDNLIGGTMADYIIGAGGGDTIKGLGGADALIGGDGQDTFVYTNASDSPVDGGDQIYQFQIGFNPNNHDIIDFAAFGITSADVTVTNNGTDTLIQANTDGAAGADLEITLVGVATDSSHIDIHY